MEFGFAHCYHLHLSMLPFNTGSFEERMDKAYGMMKKAGATFFRPHIHWNRIEPFIHHPDLKAKEVTDKTVEEYAMGRKEGVFWTETDIMVDKMLEHGIKPFLCLGGGYLHQLPLFERRRNILSFNPSNIDSKTYMGHLYLYARASVRRYKDRCRHWQLENELNMAGETAVVLKWRHGLRWFSRRFQLALIDTLYRAVKEEAPDSFTTHNICGMSYKLIPYLYDWKRDLSQWNQYMDIIGIDPFPNYSFGHPIVIGKVITGIMNDLRKMNLRKPVYILEDGYPVKPAGKGFSEERQVEYYRALLEACAQNGVDGVFIYCFSSQEGAPGNEWHRRKRRLDVEDWWGVIRADGSTRPAYDYLVNRNRQK
jgi:hypothetical protein